MTKIKKQTIGNKTQKTQGGKKKMKQEIGLWIKNKKQRMNKPP